MVFELDSRHCLHCSGHHRHPWRSSQQRHAYQSRILRLVVFVCSSAFSFTHYQFMWGSIGIFIFSAIVTIISIATGHIPNFVISLIVTVFLVRSSPPCPSRVCCSASGTPFAHSATKTERIYSCLLLSFVSSPLLSSLIRSLPFKNFLGLLIFFRLLASSSLGDTRELLFQPSKERSYFFSLFPLHFVQFFFSLSLFIQLNTFIFSSQICWQQQTTRNSNSNKCNSYIQQTVT